MRYRYRWIDRHDDLVNRPSPWPLRIEFALLAVLSILAIGAMLERPARWIWSFFS